MDAVSQVLTDRRSASRQGGLFVLGSLVMHVLLVLGAIFGPRFFEREPVQVRYVEVISIPAAQLDPGPKPVPKQAAPVPEPEPTPPEPEPDPPKPAPEDVPVLPQEKEREPEPQPQPPRADPEPEPSTEPTGEEAPRDETPTSTGRTREAEFAGFDDPEFSLRYSYYLETLIARIRREWRRPNVGEGVELVISFRILRAGNQLTELQVMQSSGSRAFDRAGFEAVQKAAPLPPLPQAYRKDSLGVRIIFR